MTVLAESVITLRNGIIAINVVAGLFLLGVVVAAVRERRRQLVQAPNQTPYLDDDELEGRRLERIGGWALAMSALIAISIPAYWLFEPTRQDAMGDQFLERSIEQGAELYESTVTGTDVALGCADCHGPRGEGGFATQVVDVHRDDVEVAEGAIDAADRVCTASPEDDESLICQVAWRAPSLDDIFLRHSREEIREVIVFGRPGTPMPAWGLEGGGAKNDQSIGNILDFLESIQISPDEARARYGDITDGQLLFQAHCARCHTEHWPYVGTFSRSEGFDIFGIPGGGAFGPSLTGDVTLRQFPNVEDHVAFIMDGSRFQGSYGARGIGSGRMPGFAQVLTESQIRAIVEYERNVREERVRLDDLVTDAAAPEDGEDGDDVMDADGDTEGEEDAS